MPKFTALLTRSKADDVGPRVGWWEYFGSFGDDIFDGDAEADPPTAATPTRRPLSPVSIPRIMSPSWYNRNTNGGRGVDTDDNETRRWT